MQILVFFIAFLNRVLAEDVSANTSFLCDKASVIRDIVKGTLCMEGTFIKLVTGTGQDTDLNALKLSLDRFQFLFYFF
jgi:hypothetical protein